MGNQQSRKKTFTFEISNFSQWNTPIQSNVFTCGSCMWYVTLYPKGGTYSDNTHMSIDLNVADHLSLPQNWFRFTKFHFVIVDKYNVRRSTEIDRILFNENMPTWSSPKAWPLTDLQSNFLVNDKLTILVYVDVKESFGGLRTYLLPQKIPETVNINGFEVLRSHEESAKFIFETFPETALYIKPQDPQVRTAYMNVLLRIFEKLFGGPLEKLTEAEVRDLSKGLLDLTQAGFKLRCFRARLYNFTAERKKLSGDGAHAEELEKLLKNLELEETKGFQRIIGDQMQKGMKDDELTNAYSELSELTEPGFKLDWLKTKLEDVSLEMKNAIDDVSRVQEKEERIKNLELTLSDLKAEVKSEKTKSATTAAKLLSFNDDII